MKGQRNYFKERRKMQAEVKVSSTMIWKQDRKTHPDNEHNQPFPSVKYKQ